MQTEGSNNVDPDIKLIESMYASREDGIRHQSLHLQRLNASAQRLGFALDIDALPMRLKDECAALLSGMPHRFRLTLAKNGFVEITHAPLAPLGRATVDVLLAHEFGFEPMRSDDTLLRHKTTRRETYDRAWQQAERLGAFDMLFVNERGELTEGGRTNVFVKLDGRWHTPPVSSGVLPGVMRRALLDDPAWRASERGLSETDLLRADELIVCNALRGFVNAKVLRRP